MLPSSSNGPLPGTSCTNQAPTPSRRPPGVRIALESGTDWKLQQIDFDGNEKYEEPLNFEDELHIRAFQINWRDILGSEMNYIDTAKPTLTLEEVNATESELNIDQTAKTDNGVVPEAGPWHGVAKNLHESLLQLNVFLDNLNVLNHTQYLAALTILDPNQSDPQSDLPNQNRCSQWVWKRKALTDAVSVLDMSIKRMEQSGIEIRENTDYRSRQQFFGELRTMREYWRIRKLGDHITGDLGYKIFGKKYSLRQVFEISRRAVPAIFHKSDLSRVISDRDRREDVFHSILQVTVPRDLARRATLTVTIVDDLPGEPELFPKIDDLHFERLRIDAKEQEQIHWKNALNWAQETLICRDAFKLLCNDAAFIHERRSIVRDGVLVTSLGRDKLLRIELKYLPFRELEPTVEDYLNRCLKQIFVAAQCIRFVRPQGFVSLPLTQFHELNDFRGPRALSTQEILDRNPINERFLTKMCKVASHYNLVKLVVSILKKLMKEESDIFPSLNFRFMRCTQTYSMIIGTLLNKQWDHLLPRQIFYIRISHDEIVVNSPSSPLHDINCHQSTYEFLTAIRTIMANFLASSVISLGKSSWLFQLVQYNGNNVAEDGTLAPTIYLYNEISTRALLIRFFVHHRVPEIKVRVMEGGATSTGPFIPLNYNRIPGGTFFRKFDNLFSMLRESENCRPV